MSDNEIEDVSFLPGKFLNVNLVSIHCLKIGLIGSIFLYKKLQSLQHVSF